MKKLILLLTLTFATASFAASRINVAIFQHGYYKYFQSNRILSHALDSVEIRNLSDSLVTLQYHISNSLGEVVPEKSWVNAGKVPSFKVDGWAHSRLKIIFGHSLPEPAKYPDCQKEPEICVWIPAQVGNFVTFRDPTYNFMQPDEPFILNFYIDLNGGSDGGDQL